MIVLSYEPSNSLLSILYIDNSCTYYQYSSSKRKKRKFRQSIFDFVFFRNWFLYSKYNYRINRGTQRSRNNMFFYLIYSVSTGRM